ncbi:MAG: hypothetical protein V1672_02895 [Candidatus Diapherotrites archaeon]
MSLFYNFFKGIIDGIPVLLRKIGSVLIMFFFIGALFGYYLSMTQTSVFYFLLMGLAIPVMWRDLDQGILLFILVLILPWVFPGII